jgi:hypothetical protein
VTGPAAIRRSLTVSGTAARSIVPAAVNEREVAVALLEAGPWPRDLLTVIARWRNRIETTFSEITEQMGLTRHGAHLLGPVHHSRSDHRRPHPDARLPRRSVNQPA